MANAIAGTLVLLGLACVIGVPTGVLGGVYLSEFGSPASQLGHPVPLRHPQRRPIDHLGHRH